MYKRGGSTVYTRIYMHITHLVDRALSLKNGPSERRGKTKDACMHGTILMAGTDLSSDGCNLLAAPKAQDAYYATEKQVRILHHGRRPSQERRNILTKYFLIK